MDLYNICNEVNPATTGISLAEYMGVTRIMVDEWIKMIDEELATQWFSCFFLDISAILHDWLKSHSIDWVKSLFV